MATVILQNSPPVRSGTASRSLAPSALERVCSLLPVGLALEVKRAEDTLKSRGERIEEIRLRGGRRAYLTVGGTRGKKNFALASVIENNELAAILKRMCGGSLYTYSDSIIKGYVSLGDGVRVGVCGRAATEKGKILGVYDVSSLNVRLPCGDAELKIEILSRIRKSIELGKGVLIYSPPAEGKTTFLRSLSRELAGGEKPLRLALVDSREELSAVFCAGELSMDVLSGYPKAEAIHIATAFMNPEVIICDEIGGEDDVKAICEAQNCGVPLIASAHGDSICSLLRRPSISSLHKVGAFGLYVGIRIDGGGFEYTLHGFEEAERIIENGGNDNYCNKRNISLHAKAQSDRK